MKKIKLRIILIMVVLAILFSPFVIHSQTKNIINLSEEEMSGWLGIDSTTNSNSSIDNPDNREPDTNIIEKSYYDEDSISNQGKSINGDEMAYSTFTNQVESPKNNDLNSTLTTQSYSYSSSGPFFNGLNQIPPVRNKYIDKYIEYFKKDKNAREWVEKSFKHFEYYFPVFRSQLKFEGLPLELMIISFVETGYNNEVKVNANKLGLWQLTQGQANKYNLIIDEYIDERKDYERATKAAVLELKRLNNIMNSWDLTIMAWAIGEKQLIKIVNQYRTKDVWKLFEAGAFGNSSRKAFLAHFYALLDIMVNAERYGFKAPRFVKGTPYYKVIINKAIELKRIEQDMKLMSGLMYAYNPQLKLKMTPPNYKDFLLKYPADPSLKSQFEIQASIYNNLPDKVVRKKDTIEVADEPTYDDVEQTPLDFSGYNEKEMEIRTSYTNTDLENEIQENYLDKYDLDTERSYVENNSKEDYEFDSPEDYKIAEENYLNNKDNEILTVENDKDKYDFDDYDYDLKEIKKDYVIDNNEQNKTVENVKNKEIKIKHDENIEYTIQFGDTLWSLYKKFNIPYQVIAFFNGIEDPTKIYADEKIIIPAPEIVDDIIADMEKTKGELSDYLTKYKDYKTDKNLVNNDKSKYRIDETDDIENTELVDISDEEIDDYEISMEYSIEDDKENNIESDYKISDTETEYIIYVVEKGDTLISIANRYNITIGEISQYNPEISLNIIPGQKIKIPI